MTIPMGPGNTGSSCALWDLKSTVLCATAPTRCCWPRRSAERGIRDHHLPAQGVIGSERWGDKMRQRIAGELGVGDLRHLRP